jgi:hypothetical protein
MLTVSLLDQLRFNGGVVGIVCFKVDCLGGAAGERFAILRADAGLMSVSGSMTEGSGPG